MKRLALVTMALLLVVLPIACGGGGGGGDNGGTPQTLTPATVDQTSSEKTVGLAMFSQEMSGMTDAADFFTMSRSNPGSFASPKMMSPVLSAIRSQVVSGSGVLQRSGAIIDVDDCYYGGTVSANLSWIGPDPPVPSCSQVVDLHGNLTFSSCEEVYDTTMNGNASISITGNLCNPSSMSITYSNFTMTSNSEQLDVQCNSFTISMNDLSWSGDMITHMRVVLNGDIMATYKGYSYSAQFSNYTTTVDTSDDINFTVSISGSLTGGCLDGWITIETLVPITVNDYNDCPSGGQVRLSGNGQMIVTFNSDGSVDVGQEHFDSCTELASDCY